MLSAAYTPFREYHLHWTTRMQTLKGIFVSILGTLIITSISAPIEGANFSLRLLGQHVFPTGFVFDGIEFGSISGLDQDSTTGTYWAISDDRGGERNASPRFYNLTIDVNESGFTGEGVKINDQRFMRRPDGTLFPPNARTVDPEGIRVAPNGNLYWISEGNYDSNPNNLYQPFAREMRIDGAFVREFNMPSQFEYVSDQTEGSRNNKVFESLTVTPSGTVVIANEDALVDDGPITTLDSGSVVRVTKFDPVTGNAVAQYAYELPPIPKPPATSGGFADNGLSELFALDENRFIAIERAFAAGVGNTIRLVLTDLTGASDVLGMASLEGGNYIPMSQELLLDFDDLGIRLDVTEGITWGPRLANGNQTLVLVSDNNFNPTQITQFLAFEVVPRLRGDFNLDGSIDAADAGILFGNWGRTGVGDIYSDGIVDAADAGELFAAWTGDRVSQLAAPEGINVLWTMGAIALVSVRYRPIPRRKLPLWRLSIS